MPNRPPGTGGRVSLWPLSQSPSPHKCRSHLGFSLGQGGGMLGFRVRWVLMQTISELLAEPSEEVQS